MKLRAVIMVAPEQRARLATEVIELGKQLFALALEGQVSPRQTAPNPGPDASDPTHPPEPSFPMAEIEAASEEFFAALRLLLRAGREEQ